jgi:hypothetical protein
MNKILLAGALAVALLALSQEHASAWFNLYAGGSASISWGPNPRNGGGLFGRRHPGNDSGYGSPYNAYPGYGYAWGDGYPYNGYPYNGYPYNGYPSSGVPSGGTPTEPARPDMQRVPDPTPKSGGSGSSQPEGVSSNSNQSGYQSVGSSYGDYSNWNWNYYQGGYQQAGYYDYSAYGSSSQAPSYWYGQ